MKPRTETPAEIEAAARTIDPGCKREGNNWVMADPTSNSGKKHALSMHCTTGIWKDFSGTAKGSSAAALLKHYKAFLPAEATQLLSKPSTAPVVAPAAASKAPSWPAASDDNIPAIDSPHGFNHTETWAYKNSQGRNVMLVARFDSPEGKTIRPYRYNRGWGSGDPAGPLPLYNLDQVAAIPEAPLLVVEGEKTAEAAQVIFPDHVCTTSAHGAGAAAKSYWGSVKGRGKPIRNLLVFDFTRFVLPTEERTLAQTLSEPMWIDRF